MWIGIAVGIVAILGIGSMTLFPDAMSGLKSDVRLSSLSFSESGQNLLYFKTNALSASDFATTVSGSERNDATVSDVSNGVINIKTGATQGHVYGAYLVHNYNQVGGLSTHDKWALQADIKTDSPDVTFCTQNGNYTGLGVGDSVAHFVSDSNLTQDWKTFKTTGTRAKNAWGTVIFYFKITSNHPVNIQIKNVRLSRVNI